MRRVALVALAFLTLAVPASAARVPLTASRDWWPVWSPTDKDIAFTRINGTGRIFQLFVYHLATRRSTLIGQSASQLSPSWSPDGERLIYASGGLLYVVHRDGRQKHRYYAPAKAYAPAFGVDGQVAYLSNGNLWVNGEQWAQGAIGQPAWGQGQVAFARDDGIFAGASRETVKKIAGAINPGPPVWSPDGIFLAYSAGKHVWIVRADGTSGPIDIAGPLEDIGPLSWSRESDALAYTVRGQAVITYLENYKTIPLARTVGVGTAFAHHGDLVAFSGSHPGCTGHASIRIYEDNTHVPSLTGGCGIAGTSGADVIFGTTQGGDVIVAGAGNDVIHANNRHRDTVNCGPGRDTVYTDRSDRLLGCEVIHR